MPSIEGIRLKFRNCIYLPITGKIRKRKLNNKNFTIISNNCWGGTIYESYSMRKESPTVGLFFMADDYIEFLKYLPQYLHAKLTFINPSTSKWTHMSEVSSDPRWGGYPVGRLVIHLKENEQTCEHSVELFFLHYSNEEEALQKWNRRVKRINWNNMLVKFNDQNGCTEANLIAFDSMPFKNKICFTVQEHPNIKSVICTNEPTRHNSVMASYEPFGKSRILNVTRLINQL